MSPNTRTILVAVANLAAIFLVVAMLNYKNDSHQETSAKLATFAGDSLPTTTSTYTRKSQVERALTTSAKGSAKGKGSSEIDCIPLYPTAAPTKGKGKGSFANSTSTKGKGSFTNSTSTKGKGSTKMHKGSTNSTSFKGSKGKGSSSEAPSYYCSDAPSVAPSVSQAPSLSMEPTSSPSLSVAPSVECEKSSKGKGSCKGGKGKTGRV